MDNEQDVASFQDIYEENEGEGYDLFLEEQEQEIRRKRKPYFRPSGMDYTLKEDRQKYFMGLERDMLTAKTFLEKPDETPPHKIVLFDHLASVINKIVTEKPPNAGEVFEECCTALRKAKYFPETDHLQDMYIPPQFTESEKIIRLLKSVQHVPVTGESIEVNDLRDGMKSMELMESLKYFETLGIGFSQLETFCIRIKLLNLAKQKVLKTYRFWGKIMGLYSDYIIAETEQFPADIQRMQDEAEAEERRKQEEEMMKQEQDINLMKENEAEYEANAAKKKEAERVSGTLNVDEHYEEEEVVEEELLEPPPKSPPEFPPIPVSTFQKPPEVPPEKRGEGSNKKVYYVYSELDAEWIQLPDVTPQQIQIARKIRKLFTGDLNAKINTYPPFPGNEINYLRAQIARISATTQVSPKGYFKFEGGRGGDGEEEEEEEEEELMGEEEDEGGRKNGPVTVNPNYRPKLMKELMQLKNWVHHQDAILQQGRCTFWSPPKESRGEGEEEEEEEEEEGEEEEEKTGEKKEKAPPLFRPVTKDVCPFAKKLWTIQASSTLTPEAAFAYIRSEIWPGFIAFCSGSNYDSLYIGWGLKYSPKHYNIPPLPTVQTEYVVGPEIMEISDPTWAQEEAWRIAHEPKVKEIKLGGEGEEEEEEEEEETDTGDSADTDE